MRRQPSALSGVAFVLAAVACFAVLDTTAKYLSTVIPVLIALWFRYLFQAVATTVTMLPLRGMNLLRTRHPKFQLLRGVLLLICSLFSFYGLQYLPVGEFTAMAMLTPLAVTVLAATVLKEKVSALRWLFVAGGFAGAMFIVRPGSGSLGWAALFPLGLVTAYASFQVLTSKMASTEDASTMHFYTGWVGAALASLALPFVWVPVTEPSWWLLMVLAGAMGTVGHLFLIFAFARAPAATLTPFQYTQIVFAMLGGWLIFDHLPDGWSVFGIVLIALCGAAGAWLTARESRVRMDPQEV